MAGGLSSRATPGEVLLGEGAIRVLPGQYFDAETGLHYNYFRDYDSSIGRYMESDPIGMRGRINTFAYVLNRPIRYTDRRGLDLFDWFAKK